MLLWTATLHDYKKGTFSLFIIKSLIRNFQVSSASSIRLDCRRNNTPSQTVTLWIQVMRKLHFWKLQKNNFFENLRTRETWKCRNRSFISVYQKLTPIYASQTISLNGMKLKLTFHVYIQLLYLFYFWILLSYCWFNLIML